MKAITLMALTVSAAWMPSLAAKASSQRATQQGLPMEPITAKWNLTDSKIPPWLAQEISMGGQLPEEAEVPLGFDATAIDRDLNLAGTSTLRSFSEIELVWVRCDEDHLGSPLIKAASALFKKVTVISKCGIPSTLSGGNVQHVSMFNRGTEGGGYLRFILDRYNDLPAWTVFVHGRPEEHRHGLLSLFVNLDDTKLVNMHEHRWLDLNGFRVRGRTLSDDDVGRGMEAIQKSLPEIGDPHSVLDFYCCNQHMASSAAIRSQTLDFWTRYYALLEESHPGHTPSGKNFSKGASNEIGVLYEHTWHRAYGEPWAGWKDDHLAVLRSMIGVPTAGYSA